MKKDFDQLRVEFNSRANAALFELYKEFEYATAGINRVHDENVFQQLEGKYTTTLRHRLENIAQEVIYKNQSLQEMNELQQSLYAMISSYVNEFVKKCNAL